MLDSRAVEVRPISPLNSIKISDIYNRWFKVIPANTPELKEKAYRLRYQVYCCEKQYETPAEHPQQLEMDTFDSRSVHSLIVNRANGAITGTVRLVLPNKEDPEASFPIQQICNHPMLSRLAPKSAEVSRFAISKKMKKLSEAYMPPAMDEEKDYPIDGKAIKCSIMLGLMRATVQMSLANGITNWFAVMEPSLLRLLCRFGIYFTPIGPLVNYHGFRQPCYVNLSELLERARQEHFDLWEFATH
jgi:N-acyl amino acid synthase of PEP-CTERM/exosortase system